MFNAMQCVGGAIYANSGNYYSKVTVSMSNVTAISNIADVSDATSYQSNQNGGGFMFILG